MQDEFFDDLRDAVVIVGVCNIIRPGFQVGLGVLHGDAEACEGDHGGVVHAVAAGDELLPGAAEDLEELFQGGGLLDPRRDDLQELGLREEGIDPVPEDLLQVILIGPEIVVASGGKELAHRLPDGGKKIRHHGQRDL